MSYTWLIPDEHWEFPIFSLVLTNIIYELGLLFNYFCNYIYSNFFPVPGRIWDNYICSEEGKGRSSALWYRSRHQLQGTNLPWSNLNYFENPFIKFYLIYIKTQKLSDKILSTAKREQWAWAAPHAAHTPHTSYSPHSWWSRWPS